MLTVGRARLRMAQLDKAIGIAQDAFAMLKKIPSTTQRICEDKVRYRSTNLIGPFFYVA